MTSLRALLAGAVDYAGLFPPAGLDMVQALQNYATYRAGEHAWALGRFIVPVSRLTEFDHAITDLSIHGAEPWKLSALAGSKPDKEMTALLNFNKRNEHVAVIDTVELKAVSIEEVNVAAKAIPSSMTTFVEIPVEPDPSPLVSVIGRSGLRAKARTGGITTDAFPSSNALARFIRTCAAADVPFKVTAGLHHPLRAEYRLTYESDSPTGMMYGFLNVFIASGVAKNGGSVEDVVEALEEQSPSAFHVSDREISWRTYRIDIARIHSLRGELATSFGSCSFTEPIEDLKSLNFL